MKQIYVIIMIAFAGLIVYLGIDMLFDIFSNREIVVGLLSVVIAVMLYFSLKPCFTKDKK